LAKVKIGSKWGYINEKGENIIPCIYDDIGSFYDGLCAVEINGKIGYVDKSGRMVVACIYDKPDYFVNEDFNNGYAAINTNGKYGFINTLGEEVIPCIYQKVKKFENQVAQVELDGKSLLIDKQGNVLEKQFSDRERNYTDDNDWREDTWYEFTDEDYPENGWDGDLDIFGRN